MLEEFFDNEKTFSVFKFLLESDSYCTPADIGEALDINADSLVPIIKKFEYLNIIEFQGLNIMILKLLLSPRLFFHPSDLQTRLTTM